MHEIPKIISLHIFAIFEKNVEDEYDFLPAEKHESFYRLIVSLWVCVARHAQGTQNNKFAILPAEKHESFLQVDSVTWV